MNEKLTSRVMSVLADTVLEEVEDGIVLEHARGTPYIKSYVAIELLHCLSLLQHSLSACCPIPFVGMYLKVKVIKKNKLSLLV